MANDTQHSEELHFYKKGKLCPGLVYCSFITRNQEKIISSYYSVRTPILTISKTTQAIIIKFLSQKNNLTAKTFSIRVLHQERGGGAQMLTQATNKKICNEKKNSFSCTEIEKKNRNSFMRYLFY